MAAEPRRTGDQALPKRVGRYEAFLQIGAGGMARVYLAVHRGQPGQKAELVVVKILRPEAVEDEHVLSLFTDEARIATRLAHPNVIRTREVIAEPPDYLLAMDFQNGQSLLEVVRRIGREAVPLDEHIYVLTKVLAGLTYAHELKDEKGKPFGIVHRDVSPANVLVSYNGEVKLLDFGIAKATGALAATRDGVVKGKLGYAAPEQCLGQPADPRSDIYAVGVMLWEAIAGRRRASGETWHSILQARLDDAEPELEEVCPEAPRALAAIVKKALARDPNDRYSTAREFQNDLRRYLSHERGTAVGPAQIAAMLKPHFEQDRAELHKSVEAFLNTLRTGKNGPLRRIPLPGSGAASPKPAAIASQGKTPAAEEEHTAPIPVDAALLMQSRGEREKALDDDLSSTPTAPPPPPESSTPDPAPPKLTPVSSVATTVPSSERSAATTKPPPPDAALPPISAPPVDAKTVTPDKPRRATPLPTDTYGLVVVSTPLASARAPAMESAYVPKKKARVWPFLLVAAAAAVGAALFVAPALRKDSKEPVIAKEPTASPEPASPAGAPSEAPKVDTVKVRISVDPPDAVVKLDGKILSGNPFIANLPKDQQAHELTVFAEGCRDVKQAVHMNQDVALLVALKCLKQARPAVRPAAARSVASASAPAAAQPAANSPAATLAPEADKTKTPASDPTKPAPDDENPYRSVLGGRQ